MFNVPKRISMVAQTRASLLDYLSQHGAGEALPSERALCGLLKVSRVTLRAALKQLERDGHFQRGRGRTRVVRKSAPASARPGRPVVVVAPQPLHQLEPRAIYMLDELREQLGAAGLEMHFASQPALYASRPEAGLEKLAAQLRPACWVLYRSTQAIQEWVARHRQPGVVIGSPHADIALPAVQADYRATTRHAAQRLLARGHPVIALLNPAEKLAGILESEQGFGEAATRGATLLIEHHQGTRESVQHVLDTLLARASRPTGFVVMRPAHALTALGHLMLRGCRIPGAVSLIALEHDSFLDHTVPRVACYVVNPVVFAHRLCRQVLAVVGGGEQGGRTERIMPEFRPGETLG